MTVHDVQEDNCNLCHSHLIMRMCPRFDLGSILTRAHSLWHPPSLAPPVAGTAGEESVSSEGALEQAHLVSSMPSSISTSAMKRNGMLYTCALA